MAFDPNPLEIQPKPRIRGLNVLLFVVLAPAVVMGVALILRERLATADLMVMLATVFGSALVGLILAVAPLGGRAIPALGFRIVGWRWLVFGPLAALAVSVAASQTGLEPKGMKDALDFSREPAHFVISLLVVAGLAPLVEELIFRGLLYGWLEARWGATVAFIVSSIAFALAHYEPAHIILVLPLGLLFGWLRKQSDSLLPSLVAHVANNALAVIAAAYL